MSSSSSSAVLQLLRRLEAQNVWARASSTLSGGLGAGTGGNSLGRDDGASYPGYLQPFSRGYADWSVGGSQLASSGGSGGLGSGTQVASAVSLSSLRTVHARQASSSSPSSPPSSSSSSSSYLRGGHDGRDGRDGHLGGSRILPSPRSTSPENQRYLLHSRSAWVAFMSTGGLENSAEEADLGGVEGMVGGTEADEQATAATLTQLTTRVTETGPIKQRQLQDLYLSCSSPDMLKQAVDLTRLNYLARGELHQHGPFSNKTCSTLLQQAMKLEAVDIAKHVILNGGQYGFGAPSTRQYNMLLIYYSKKGLLKEMVEMYERMKANGPVPDSETCFILVKGFVDASRGDVARVIVGEFEKAGVRVRDGARLYIDQHE